MNILMDFVLNENDRERNKRNSTRKTSWMCRPRPQACCIHEKKKRRDIA